MLKIEFYQCLVPVSFKNNKGYLLSEVVYPVKRTRRLGTQILVQNGFWRDFPPKLLEDSKLFKKVESLVFNNYKELNVFIDTYLFENNFKRDFNVNFYLSLNPLETKTIKLSGVNGLVDYSDYISNYELIYSFKNENEVVLNIEDLINNLKYGELESLLINSLLK